MDVLPRAPTIVIKNMQRIRASSIHGVAKWERDIQYNTHKNAMKHSFQIFQENEPYPKQWWQNVTSPTRT